MLNIQTAKQMYIQGLVLGSRLRYCPTTGFMPSKLGNDRRKEAATGYWSRQMHDNWLVLFHNELDVDQGTCLAVCCKFNMTDKMNLFRKKSKLFWTIKHLFSKSKQNSLARKCKEEDLSDLQKCQSRPARQSNDSIITILIWFPKKHSQPPIQQRV